MKRIDMKTTLPTGRAGFTLIEMSIVLIIIGVLVGGVLGMRSYLQNAERSTMMNEAKFFIAMFDQFQTRYNALAGDYTGATAAWSGSANGDGNGRIRAVSPSSSACSGAGASNCIEWFNVFEHLALAGFIQGTYTGVTAGGVGTFDARIGTNIPSSSVDKVGFLFDHPDAADGNVSSDTTYFDGIYSNVLRIAGHGDTESGIPDNAFMTAKVALQLDEKFDDGVPNTGILIVPKSATDCYDNGTTPFSYKVTTAGSACYFLYKM
jgi:prepilin-type N-terminal cleavage/methylation domain-containing protein